MASQDTPDNELLDDSDDSPLDSFIDEQDAETEKVGAQIEGEALSAREAAEAQKLALEGTKQFVAGLLDAGEVKLRAKLPYVKVDPKEKEAVVVAAAPVLLKYQAGPPAWMLPYMAEFALLAAAGSLAFSIWSQVQEHKLMLMEEERKRQERAKQEQTQVPGSVNLATGG